MLANTLEPQCVDAESSKELILSPSRSLSFVDALRPPREERGGADQIPALLQDGAALQLDVVEVLDVGKVAVEQRRVTELPEVLAGLHLRRVGGQDEQMDVLWHEQGVAGVPARSIEHEDDLLARSCPRRVRKGSQLDGEEIRADPSRQMPDGATGGGMDEGDDIAPDIARLDRGDGALAR